MIKNVVSKHNVWLSNETINYIVVIIQGIYVCGYYTTWNSCLVVQRIKKNVETN